MILAAGFGTRLGALSDERPKPLLPVADVPLVRWALALLRGAGIRDVVVNLHHRGELVERELGADVAYSREEKILGTGGGIRRALPFLGPDPFVVVNGKIVIDLDLGEVIAAHRASGARATLVVRPDPQARRWGAIDAPAGGGRIRGLLGDGAFMFTGIHVIDPELIARLPDDGAERCIVRQGYVPWLAEGVPLGAFVAPGYFMEHSTPERYLEGNLNLLRGTARVRHAPPGTHARVDAAAEVHPRARLVAPVLVAAGARVGPGAEVGPDVVLGANARVGEGVTLRRAVVWPGAAVLSDLSDGIQTPDQRVVPSPSSAAKKA
jgi:mannose-1-phosphate guanylyltransferase